MSKDDELVLVIPSEILFEKGKWQGLKTADLDYYLDLIKNNCEFKRRGDVEQDDSFQQIIPYILFTCQDQFFVYKYLPAAGESRLVDTYQIGIGGHINPIDGAGDDILEAGMMREWNEEVDYKGNIIEKKFIGLLKDDSRQVEQVHVGLVFQFTGDSANIAIKETDKMAGEMVPLNEIGKKIEGNDGIWIKLVYRDYLSQL